MEVYNVDVCEKVKDQPRQSSEHSSLRRVSWVKPRLPTIFEEDEDKDSSDTDVDNYHGRSEFEDTSEIVDLQLKRRASDPDAHAQRDLERFHLFLEQENQEQSGFSLPSISQHISPLLHEKFALDYDEESQIDLTTNGSPAPSLVFEAVANSSTTSSEGTSKLSPAQSRKAAFLSSLHQAEKEVRREMQAKVEMQEAEQALHRAAQREQQKFACNQQILRTLISLRLRMATSENLVPDATNPCLFKRSPDAAVDGAAEVRFVSKQLVTLMRLEPEKELIERAVKLLIEEGT